MELKPLRTLRDQWIEIEKVEITLARAYPLTIQESAQQFMELYQEFAPYLEATEHIYRSDRIAYLIELQERLQRLAEWQKEQGEKIVSESETTANQIE